MICLTLIFRFELCGSIKSWSLDQAGPWPLDLKMEEVKEILGLSQVRFWVTLDPPIPLGIIYAYGSR